MKAKYIVGYFLSPNESVSIDCVDLGTAVEICRELTLRKAGYDNRVTLHKADKNGDGRWIAEWSLQ